MGAQIGSTYRLRTFGTLAVDSATPLRGAAAQRKTLALLAILAAAGEDGIARDRLLLYLWPDTDTERGRNALNQSLHALRRDFHDDELVLGTSALRLNPSSLASDITEFEAALGRADPECAIGLYRGPFLDGFYLRNAPEFERWVEDERARLAERACSALERLATGATEHGDHQRAAEWSRRLAALDPLNSRFAVGLITALAAVGDRAGALQHARVHEQLLLQQLDLPPAPGIAALVSELRAGPPRDELPSRAGARPEETVEPSPQIDARVRTTNDAAAQGPRPTDPTDEGPDRGIVPVAEVGARTARPVAGDTRPTRRNARLVRSVAALSAAAVLVAAVAMMLPRPPRGLSGLDPNLIVVVPFRVADSSLAYLGEGMMDLLNAKLTGDSGPQTVDPRTVMSVWRGQQPLNEALRLAERLRAGQLMLGEVVRTPSGLTINAELRSVPGGQRRARATVEGKADALNALIERLAGQLLAREAEMEEQRIGGLGDIPLAAIRAYLAGQAAVRRGRYPEAVRHFDDALEVDSTFALAALGQRAASIFLPGHSNSLRYAWAARDRLSKRDRAYLVAEAGPRYPEASPASERVAAWEAAVAVAPARPELWYRLGDSYFHDGALLALADWYDLAVHALRRAIELDSSAAAPYEHLVQLAAHRGDTALMRQIGTPYLLYHASAGDAPFIRWRMALALGDGRTLRALRSEFDSMPLVSLRSIAQASQYDGIATGDADRALALLRSRTRTPADEADALVGLHDLALNRGRPQEATMWGAELGKLGPIPDHARRHAGLRTRVLDALYSDGDTTAAARAAGELASDVDSRLAQPAGGDRSSNEDVCVVEQWRLWRGQVHTAAHAIARLRGVVPGQAESGVYSGNHDCAGLLEAFVAVAEDRPTARALLARADSLMRTGPAATYTDKYANLVIARLMEARGDRAGALAALRRRTYFRRWPRYLSTYLREEGRLAAMAADTTRATRAYEHYLTLRSDPEPAVAPRVAQVQTELARLAQGQRRFR